MKESDDKAAKNLVEALRYIDGEKEVVEFLPQRVPLVDQALELAKRMKEVNAPKEIIEELLSVAAKAYRQFSNPVYIVKEKND